METDVVWISFLLVVSGVIGAVLLINKFGSGQSNLDFAGIWLNESLNLRILIHDIDSEYQGSVIWANGMDKLLGFKMVQNLKFDKSRKGSGKYIDPITGQHYQLSLRMKAKGILQVKAFHPNSNNLAFSQEWKQIEA